jgi:WD40 repeat protein
MCESRFIPLHSAQIQDIAPSPYDQQVLATISLDKMLCVTSLRTQQKTLEKEMPNPCWSVAWIEPMILAVGGTNGRLFVVDGSPRVICETTLAVGPPIVSLCRIGDSMIIACSVRKSRVFDGRRREWIGDEYAGCRCFRVCGSTYAAIRDELMEIGRIEEGKLKCERIIKLERFRSAARCDIIKSGGGVYCGFPDDDGCDFEVRKVGEEIDRDLWGKYSRCFGKFGGGNAIVDMRMHYMLDFFVGCLSSDLLRIYALPVH